MAIASTIEKYLGMHSVPFDVLKHPHTITSLQAAEAAHVGGDQLAKAVLVEDENGYLVAVLPASRHLDLGRLRRETGRRLGLATESEIPGIFSDCEPGVIPAVGLAYGIETVVDDSLMEQPDIYFEAGDHEELIHLSGTQFMELLGTARHGAFSSPGYRTIV